MKRTNAKLGWMLAAMSYVLIGGGTALADDTELFIAGEDNSGVDPDARPNIMFIIDTSGSMGSTVLTQEAWNPNVTFAGCYRSDSVYWSTTPQQPGCGSGRWFPKTRNFCESSKQLLSGIGEYSGSLLAWRPRGNASRSRWVPLSNSRNRNVECVADAGVHGSAPGQLWAADGTAGPWSGNDGAEPAWTTSYTLFDGNYLNWLQSGGTVVSTRIDIVKEVTNNLLDNLEDVNVGLMRFNNADGGPVLHEMEDIDTARNEMKTIVNGLPANGWTPLSETLYEAGQYFAGRNVVYGNGFTVDSVPESRVGGNANSNVYETPIDFACQKNYIVLLTDGEPTQDRGAIETRVEGLPGFVDATGGQCERMPGANNDDGKCLDEMAGYLRNHDLSTQFFGDQTVTTYTIGFTIDLPLLAETARKGGGGYYLADNTSTLTSALTKIVVSILDDASTFTAPSVPVNAFNRTQNLDDIFVSVFNPSSTLRWPGNLKKYKLLRGEFIDANLANAIDPDTGFFRDEAQSFWSATPDGASVTAGGAAERLPEYGNRNLYTNIAGGDLNAPANAVVPSNTGLTDAVLGIQGPLADDFDQQNAFLMNLTDRERLILWMRGLDIFDENDNGSDMDTRRTMGDPLHVRPVPVIYGGTATNPDMVIFIATNDGYLHAVDPDTGDELWSFVPERLLPAQQGLYADPVSPLRQYGIDGEITTVILNDDGLGGITGNERAILTFGMRRGGDALFAIDVTDRNDPQLLWEIDSSTPGFSDLGQTWSTPQASRVKLGGTARDVLFFGGGYDTGQDNETYREDTVGNAVYMVDTETGQLLWSAGNGNGYDLNLPEMTHSIPAPLLVTRLNGDGFASRLYFGDMGGRIWRIDLINGNPVADFAEGGVLASLGGAANAPNPSVDKLRRFYNQVDVANVVGNGERFLAVNVGSGYRAHPLDRDIDEVFFSVRDFNVSTVIPTDQYPAPVTFDELIDITNLGDVSIAYGAKGWRMTMDASPGEKVLGRSITFDGTIFFTSFAPGSGANACTAVAGQNRLYAVSLFNGFTILDTPFVQLQQGGIAPQPELVYVPSANGEDAKTIVLSGTEPTEVPVIDPITRTYWTQDGAQ
ncbi:MAG: PilC/PilY family type IV pilus protein [Gammaproteobacteria bacterium]|jgi:type IV pilus assembly protein PilY1|nr:PilC/PilY family type IV pilus protein [Gammaproteobacteria bacterium]